jgi:hypothetical protein
MKATAFLGPLLVLLAAGTARGQAVETGVVKWEALPPVRVADDLNYSELDRLAERLVANDGCRAAGYHADRFAFDAPYAVLVQPDGTVERIVIEPNAKCPDLDYVVGLAVRTLSKRHRFKGTREAHARWYAGRIAFGHSPQSQ